MRNYIIFLGLISFLYTNAQVEPILDYTWTIEKIDTGTEIIDADLNPSGEYDTFEPTFTGIFDNTTFYYQFFGNCEFNLSFDDSNSEFYYHIIGCTLSNQDSSEIALYFNQVFVQENTNEITIDNEFFPFAFGPLEYSFRTEEDIIYLDITNSIGEVATFYANNLSQEEFLKESITIYPNPATDVLKIEGSGVAIDNIKIYDIKGRLLKESKIKIENQINVSSLPKGIYILHIETAVGVLSKKLIKQ